MGAYDLATGWRGMLALWGGLYVQVSLIVLFAGMAGGGTTQPVGTAVAAYFLSAVIYFVFDVAYVYGLEMRVNNWLFDSNGFERPGLQRPILLPTFFLYAAAANTLVVILPALDAAGAGEPDYWGVALRGFMMGNFSYANLALVNAWSFPRYPLELVGLMPLSGGAFSCISSLLTTLICSQL